MGDIEAAAGEVMVTSGVFEVLFVAGVAFFRVDPGRSNEARGRFTEAIGVCGAA